MGGSRSEGNRRNGNTGKPLDVGGPGPVVLDVHADAVGEQEDVRGEERRGIHDLRRCAPADSAIKPTGGGRRMEAQLEGSVR